VGHGAGAATGATQAGAGGWAAGQAAGAGAAIGNGATAGELGNGWAGGVAREERKGLGAVLAGVVGRDGGGEATEGDGLGSGQRGGVAAGRGLDQREGSAPHATLGDEAVVGRSEETAAGGGDGEGGVA